MQTSLSRKIFGIQRWAPAGSYVFLKHSARERNFYLEANTLTHLRTYGKRLALQSWYDATKFQQSSTFLMGLPAYLLQQIHKFGGHFARLLWSNEVNWYRFSTTSTEYEVFWYFYLHIRYLNLPDVPIHNEMNTCNKWWTISFPPQTKLLTISICTLDTWSHAMFSLSMRWT